MLAVALAHGFRRGNGGFFHDAQKLQRKIGFEISRGIVCHDWIFCLNFGCPCGLRGLCGLRLPEMMGVLLTQAADLLFM